MANQDPWGELALLISNATQCIGGLVAAGVVSEVTGGLAPVILDAIGTTRKIQALLPCVDFMKYIASTVSARTSTARSSRSSTRRRRRPASAPRSNAGVDFTMDLGYFEHTTSFKYASATASARRIATAPTIRRRSAAR